MTIRGATQEDLASVLRIEKASFASDAWSRRAFEYYLKIESEFLVAMIADDIAGYAIVVTQGSRAVLDSIAVAPEARGQGVATRLLSRLLRMLRRRAVTRLTLMVRRDNSTAIEFYKKRGFARVRRVNDYYQDGSAAWRMSLNVTTTSA